MELSRSDLAYLEVEKAKFAKDVLPRSEGGCIVMSIKATYCQTKADRSRKVVGSMGGLLGTAESNRENLLANDTNVRGPSLAPQQVSEEEVQEENILLQKGHRESKTLAPGISFRIPRADCLSTVHVRIERRERNELNTSIGSDDPAVNTSSASSPGSISLIGNAVVSFERRPPLRSEGFALEVHRGPLHKVGRLACSLFIRSRVNDTPPNLLAVPVPGPVRANSSSSGSNRSNSSPGLLNSSSEGYVRTSRIVDSRPASETDLVPRGISDDFAVQSGMILDEVAALRPLANFRFRRPNRQVSWDRVRALRIPEVVNRTDVGSLFTLLEGAAMGDTRPRELDGTVASQALLQQHYPLITH